MSLDINLIKARDYFSRENNFKKISHIDSRLIIQGRSDLNSIITIFIPTYKRSHTLKEAIYSVLNNDYNNYDILVVDNEAIGETYIPNETEAIIRKINDSRITLYRNVQNVGMIGNWNRCLELSKTKYVVMLHDDDLLSPRHLSTLMKIILSSNKIKFLGCSYNHIDMRSLTCKVEWDNIRENSYKLKYRDIWDFNYGFKTPLLGAVVDRLTAVEIGGFSLDSLIEDYVFVSKFAYYHGVYQYPAKLYGYRWAENYSLKTNIWQDELVHEYYLYKQIAQM